MILMDVQAQIIILNVWGSVMSEGFIDRLKARAPKGSSSSQIFTWVGIVGATITLVGNLSTLITLANWCRSLVALYHTSLEQVAAWLSAWLKVELDPASVAFGLYFFFSCIDGGRSSIGIT